MKKWWEEPETLELEYIPIVKMVPVVTYETIIEHEFIYQTIIEKIPEYIYETIVQEEYIYETIIEKVPEYIYETISEYETIYETVMEEVPVYIYEIIKEPEYIYETIVEKEIEYKTVYEIIYETLYETITVTLPLTEEDIKEYIRDNPAEIIEIIKDNPVFGELIKEYIKTRVKEIIKIIKADPDWKEILKEIIKEIPPEEITRYLTEEQVKYIIQQQPPQVILQTIDIIDIEYIIFSGDASAYNGNSPSGGTSLSTQEKNTNDTIITAMAKALKDNPDYLVILHGHANPVTYSPTEIAELMSISTTRANAVDTALKAKFSDLGGNTAGWGTRVSASGYGGEKNLSVTNSTYAGLNRRVEMILVRVGI
jgi:hypothetical protein